MQRWGRIFVLLLVLWGTSLSGQELSQEVYPSEDELWEALCDRVISYEQYEVLRDLVDQGVDSTTRYLLDQIPNLLYLMRSDSAFTDSLESEQSDGFVATRDHGQGRDLIDGRVSYRYLMLMDDDDQAWYRGQADLTVADRWRAGLRFSRERSGKERISGRTLGYRSRAGLLRRLDIGTFTTRFGLGLMFGHRGRVLEATSGFGSESWLLPDFGVYNGLSAEMKSGSLMVRTLASATRDTTHRLLAGGVEVKSTNGKLRPGAVGGMIRLTNRQTGMSVDVPMTSVLLEHSYGGGDVAVEIGSQWGRRSAGGLAVEGRHLFESAQLRYAVWRYGDEFIDLTSGGKSGSLYLTDTLESVAFDFRSRRTGQSGAVLRTTVPLSGRATWSNSLLHAANRRDDNRQQLSSEISYSATSHAALRLSYLGDWRREATLDPADRSNHQFRAEVRYDGDRMKTKCYIGYRTDSRSEDRVALFLSGKYKFPDGTVYEVWSNFSRIGPDGLERCYLYWRGSWRLTDLLNCGAKVIHSYSRASDMCHTTQLSLEMAADL